MEIIPSLELLILSVLNLETGECFGWYSVCLAQRAFCVAGGTHYIPLLPVYKVCLLESTVLVCGHPFRIPCCIL